MLIAVPETIWSARRWIEKTACTRPMSPPNRAAPSRPTSHEPPLSQAQMPKKAAGEHHALEPDVDHARALGDEPAEAGEDQRRGVLQRGREEPGRDDVLERRPSAPPRARGPPPCR